MTIPATFSLEPEVEALIQEIARDPRSSFLQVERPKSPRGLLQSWEPVSSTSAGWTAAERHLFDAHREEVAHWMRTKVLVEVLKLPGERNRIWTTGGPAAKVIESSTDQRQRGRRLVTIGSRIGDPSLSAALVDRRNWSAPDLHELAIASVRLVPCSVAWLRVSLTLHHLGHYGTRLSLLHRWKRETASGLIERYFWHAIGATWYRRGRSDLALKAYETSCMVAPVEFHAAASMLANALLIGARDAAEKASRWIDACIRAQDKDVDSYLQEQSAALGLGFVADPEATRTLARRISDEYGPVTRRLVHAYA